MGLSPVCVVLLLVAVVQGQKGVCELKLHGSDHVVGVVHINTVPGGVSMMVNANSENIRVGNHGFHVHGAPVEGMDCKSTGGHYNPEGVNHGAPTDSVRHVGDLGNVVAKAAGVEQGEWCKHLASTLPGSPFDPNPLTATYSSIQRAKAACSAEASCQGIQQQGTKFALTKGTILMRAHGPKVGTSNAWLPGKCGGQIQAMLKDNVVSLTGEQSIIGRAIVLHDGEDDLGKGGDAGSLKTGNAGSRVACCTIASLDDPNKPIEF